jgi:eukaryotic-like serine/threonine-protein kinase
MDPRRWQEIERLYHLAAEMRDSRQAEFLDESCCGDEELRREVESLLASGSASADFLERPALEVAAQDLAAQSTAPRREIQGTYGHYRILDKLGEGGMGAVYAAEDARLGRRVALKFLPADLAGDPVSLERFRIEARAASALNHPNICTIYDLGETDGQPFLVMELLEGQTLRSLIERQPLDESTAIDFAIQVADALETAHAGGILHRDLKPENLFATRRGSLKILDFGVAKLLGREPADGSAAGLTWPGSSPGTAAYMSPEQARGEELDVRSDLFSVGAVLYEMATGRPAFPGKTTAMVFDAVLNRPPTPAGECNPKLSPGFAAIVAKALERDRSARYQTAAELRADLARVRHTPTAGPLRAPAQHKRKAPPAKLLVAAGALLLLVVVAWWMVPLYSRGTPRALPTPFTSFPGHETDPAFSPDGSKIAFAWDGENQGANGQFSIYVQLVGESTPLRLTKGTADRHPIWRPDGRYVAFLRAVEGDQRFEILTVPETGGPERKLADVQHSREPRISWSPDGKELALTDVVEGGSESVFLLDVVSGARRRLTFPQGEDFVDSDPTFSPDGKTLSFVRRSASLIMDLYSVPVAGGPVTQLTHERTVISNQAWTADGTRILFTMQREPSLTLWSVPATGGTPERVDGIPDGVDTPTIDARGGRLAYAQLVFNENIWRFELDGGAKGPRPPEKWIASSKTQDSPQFSPDGSKIAFVSTRTASAEIWVCGADGSKPLRLTSVGGYRTGTPRWSPDSRKIVFDSRLRGKPEIYVVDAQGGEPVRVENGSGDSLVASWSHDGLWIYFASRRSGPFQIWKVPAAGGDAVQLTQAGGFEPYESPDGAFVYYTKAKDHPGVWRVPSNGGAEAAVPQLAKAGFPRYWTMTNRGVYFVPEGTAALHFFDLNSSDSRRLIDFLRPPTPSLPGLAISPDGRWALYSQVDEDNADIMLVEHFR